MAVSGPAFGHPLQGHILWRLVVILAVAPCLRIVETLLDETEHSVSLASESSALRVTAVLHQQ